MLRKKRCLVGADAGEVAVKRRRDGRGWGPFSAGQLTTIVCVGMVTILFPVGAWAVTGSNLFVTDATSGVHAVVSPAGALNVAPAPPSKLFHSPELRANGVDSCTKVVDSSLPYPLGGGGTMAEVITGIEVTVTGTPGMFWQMHRAANCTDSGVRSFWVDSTPGGMPNYQGVQIEFPSGLAIPKGQGLYVLTSGDADVFVMASGYLVPGASVPAGA